MKSAKRRKSVFRPSMNESKLEDRLVLTAGTASANVIQVIPHPAAIAPNVTPAPAPSPISASVFAAARPLTVARLRLVYRQQALMAMRDLRSAIRSQIAQLGTNPTAQQSAAFNANVAGALNATALRLSTQASLLPNASARLVPAIQNALLGTSPRSLINRLSGLAASGRFTARPGIADLALTRVLNASSLQTSAQLNNFFRTTPVNRLSVDTNGNRIPLQQFMASQLINGVGNNFGLLAQNFPGVANSVLFPNGVVGTPTPAAQAAFNTQINNALATSAFQLGSGLSVFPRSSSLISQLQPVFFGNGTNSLTTNLQNLQLASPEFNTTLATAFNNGFQNTINPLNTFFNLPNQTNVTLPTTGFLSPFGTGFTGNSFFNGFNNGFATGTNPGFIGFGMAPTSFNTGFGTGFNNFVTNFNTGLGFNSTIGAGFPSTIGAGFPTGTTVV